LTCSPKIILQNSATIAKVFSKDLPSGPVGTGTSPGRPFEVPFGRWDVSGNVLGTSRGRTKWNAFRPRPKGRSGDVSKVNHKDVKCTMGRPGDVLGTSKNVKQRTLGDVLKHYWDVKYNEINMRYQEETL